MPAALSLSLACALRFVVRQHLPLPLDALAEHILKRGVTFAFLNMLCDCRADHVRNRLTIDGRDRIQFL